VDADGVLDELRAIWERTPVPRERWHAWVDVIAELHADVSAGLDVLDGDDEAQRALAGLIEDGREPARGPEDAVAAAIRRLDELPRPDGKHPYLEDILPALEVAEVVLAAVASTPAARRRFAELAQRAPASTPTGSYAQSGSSASGSPVAA
jgi:hypothetical protein